VPFRRQAETMDLLDSLLLGGLAILIAGFVFVSAIEGCRRWYARPVFPDGDPGDECLNHPCVKVYDLRHCQWRRFPAVRIALWLTS
jgi:hypothetical protein